MNTHHLHSSSDDEDDRLKEFNFPEEAVLQQVGAVGGAGRGGCSGRPALTAPRTLAGLHGLPDAAHDLSLHRPLWLQ